MNNGGNLTAMLLEQVGHRGGIANVEIMMLVIANRLE